jgi:hypothetical protein
VTLTEAQVKFLKLHLDCIYRAGHVVQDLTGYSESLPTKERRLHDAGVNVAASVLVIRNALFKEEI